MLVWKRKTFGEKEHCVYRYVENGSGKIIYVGKTNSSLRARVCAHRYEEPFQSQPPFHIEYIVLENSVETDSVEKFFINKWKPPLNTKDNVNGLADVISSEMEHLKWIPYEKYEQERQSSLAIRKLVCLANTNALFLQHTLDANIYGKFTFPSLISDASFLSNGNTTSLIEKEIVPCADGYVYTLTAGAKEYIINHYEEIESSIWFPILMICKMTDDEELKYSIIAQQNEFCEEIDEFARNGFENENSAYHYNFRTEYKGADVYYPFSMLFDGAPYINIDTKTLNGDISLFSYETEMPRIKKSLAESLLEFVYDLKTPVISNELLIKKEYIKQNRELCMF